MPNFESFHQELQISQFGHPKTIFLQCDKREKIITQLITFTHLSIIYH